MPKIDGRQHVDAICFVSCNSSMLFAMLQKYGREIDGAICHVKKKRARNAGSRKDRRNKYDRRPDFMGLACMLEFP